MTRRLLSSALAGILVLTATSSVRSQPGGGGGTGAGGGGMPSKQEVEKKIKEYLDGLSDQTAELGGFKITYKPVPADPAETVKGQLPPNVKAEQAVKMFLPIAKPYLEKYLGDAPGKLAAQSDWKYGKAKAPAGEYSFGLVVQDLVPVAMRVTGKGLKAPIQIPLKPKPSKETYANLKIELKEGKKDDVQVEVGFGHMLCTGTGLQAVKP